MYTDDSLNSIIEDYPVNQLQKTICKYLNKTGIFYRIFGRRKTSESIIRKIELKNYNQSNRMQDLFGIRIALYFKDDISICRDLIEKKFEVVDISEDIQDKDHFKPTRLNYVCRIPSKIKETINNELWSLYPIDDTFEIQIRTVFSEGWHEIEHDLRYKCQKDWENEIEASRALNGILATLEVCDWSIITMFDNLAYKMYQSGNWEAMIRNKFRIRLFPSNMSSELTDIFNADKTIAKEFLKVDRNEFIKDLFSFEKASNLQKNYNNLIYSINHLYIHNEDISLITPIPITQAFISKT